MTGTTKRSERLGLTMLRTELILLLGRLGLLFSLYNVDMFYSGGGVLFLCLLGSSPHTKTHVRGLQHLQVISTLRCKREILLTLL